MVFFLRLKCFEIFSTENFDHIVIIDDKVFKNSLIHQKTISKINKFEKEMNFLL